MIGKDTDNVIEGVQYIIRGEGEFSLLKHQGRLKAAPGEEASDQSALYYFLIW